MSYYEVSRAPGSGLGYAQVISAILGPLVEGGAAAYGTYAGSKQAKAELRARKQEFELAQQAEARALKVQQRQFELAQRAAIQQAQIERVSQAQRLPYVTAAIGLGALALVAVAALKGPKRRPAKKKRRRKKR